MRFYDIFDGSISFDKQGKAHNIKDMSFKSLGERVGYVGQEPVLIGKTIR